MAELGKAENIIVGAASLFMGNEGVTDVTAKPAFKNEATAGANDGESYRTTLQGTAGTPVVPDPAEDDASVSAAWRPVGFTQEGLEISYEPDYGDVEVDQLLDSAVVFKQSMRVSLNTTLAEATLFNLMVAWGQSGSTLTGAAGEQELDIESGALGEAPIERPFIAVGNSPRAGGKYGERVYHAYRTLNVESSTHSMRRNENTGIPVSFRALPADNGLYGKIKDRKRQW